MKRLHYLLFLPIFISLFSCSKDYPSAPPAPGKAIFYNESGCVIVIEKYTHYRDEQNSTKAINRNVVNRGSYSLVNLLDNTNSRIFQGGDRVFIKYKSRDNDPDNPLNPLFSGYGNIEINGDKTVIVRRDGSSGK